MITGEQLRDALISGANAIAKNKTAVDELNIFPVPDGDTGTNMSMTMMSASGELQKLGAGPAEKVAATAASALLRGARGNSGVILSLLFRGFSKGLAGKESVSGRDFADALALGVEAAYKAVMKPTEGTILTVARVAAEKGKAAAEENDDAVFVWAAMCEGAAEALETTPELLPVLKKAGVVDAGGKGLTIIFNGMLSVFRDGVMVEYQASDPTGDDFFRNAAAEFDQEINFTYCTEFIVGRNPEVSTDPQKLRAFLETIGDCVLVVDDDEIIKVHVHTEAPGNALEAGLAYGQLLTVKIENMKEQHRKAAEENEQKKAEAAQPETLEPVDPEEGIGFVAVAAGDGLRTLFTDLGCSHVVSGGQTMNPSTEDIVEAIKATAANIVFVLPNNKNIIMAAEQSVALCPERRVIVLPTRTVPQGLSAMLAFNPDASPEQNTDEMMAAAGHVLTGQITFAARDSEFGGFKIKEGEILALQDGKLVFSEKDINKAALKLTKSMAGHDAMFVTVIYGEDVSDEQAEELLHAVETKLGSHVEVTLVKGGQPIYYYIISVE
ncbi:MAG: DAK2 domain-containing protein [Firmicutes bacterium]|nr:DAK2 domain-containing protein [Bacillota bacterium]